jgi:16S rRNA (cytosine1402-N4)-methyltransferase
MGHRDAVSRLAASHARRLPAVPAESGVRRDSEPHVPVLLEEVMSALQPRDGGTYADCTFGRGGHARALLARGGPRTRVLALDRDPEAVREARALAAHDPRLSVAHARFGDLAQEAAGRGLRFDGVLFDLGVSSPQIDTPQRGFSLRTDGPLDMRMDPGSGPSAAQWLAAAGEGEIAEILREYGEERHARRIAAALVRARAQAPITTTLRLATLVAEAMPGRSRRADPGQHPATRTFQAIRIHVNHELEELDHGLAQALEVLLPGGRLAVISFHSLEDRRVKRFLRHHARPPRPSRHLPLPEESPEPRLVLLGRAVRAGDVEVARNPRARSAVLRVAEKLR